MAKKSAVNKNAKRRKMAQQYAPRRARLKAVARDRSLPPEERFQAYLKLAQLPRNGAPVRIRNRCELSGRPRGVYRKFGLGRIKLRELAMRGEVPGVVKASW